MLIGDRKTTRNEPTGHRKHKVWIGRHMQCSLPSPRINLRAPGRASSVWRRGWDSNPRSSYPDSSFRDCPIRPLSHLSVMNRTSAGFSLEQVRRTCSTSGPSLPCSVPFCNGFSRSPEMWVATALDGVTPEKRGTTTRSIRFAQVLV